VPKIQVALDLTSLKRAVDIATDAYLAGINWIEAGTPLIKSEGMETIRVLRRKFPKATIVADMKTLDAGAIETQLALEAGANIVSVSGLAHDRTLLDSLKVSRKYDGRIMADLLRAIDPHNRAKHLQTLGVDIVCMHTGVDMQHAQATKVVARKIKQTFKGLNVYIAAAGGINPELVTEILAAGVKILIVGGWITNAKNAYIASKRIVNATKSSLSHC
jgi:3-hexulose-6-phosphate synthase/6-phospho-3-hexuloisomerase